MMGHPSREIGPATLYHGDCLEVLRTLPDNSVDLILTDPPYFRVKDEPWDRAWDSTTQFLAWLGEVLQAFERGLKPNGSLYLFASPQLSARVEVLIGQTFHVLNRVTWKKGDESGNGRHSQQCREAQRSFFPQTESIIFAEHKGADNIAKGEAGYVAKCDELRGFVFEPIRSYLAGEMEAAGHTLGSVNKAWQAWKGGNGGMSSHWFTSSQWVLPTAKNYQWLRELFNPEGDPVHLRREYVHLRREYEDLRREHEDLRREYEDLRREYEGLRRPFSLPNWAPKTDVWEFSTVPPYPGKHPCEKPLDLLEHIIETSSRPGAVVLDAFAGHGNTGIAAMRLGRRAILIEKSDHHFHAAATRLEVAAQAPHRITRKTLAGAVRVAHPATPDLFHDHRPPSLLESAA